MASNTSKTPTTSNNTKINNTTTSNEVSKKCRNFCFTLYDVAEDQSDILETLVTNGFCKTIMFTHELGSKNDNPHIQGYLITNNMNSFTNIKSKINELFKVNKNPHIEAAKGTALQNLEYITKELKNNPTLKHRIFGERPLPPGKKRDDSKFESYVSMIEKGEITIKQIEEQDRAHYLRHENFYISLISSLTKTSNKPPPFVAWFAGTTGTGKSYTAKKIAKTLGYEIYEAGVENNFYNKYSQEDCAIWDDYRSGPITFNNLLNITDVSGCMINVKGTKVFFKPRIFIFTSPEGIDSAKTKEMIERNTLDNKFDQLKRRIKYQATIKNDSIYPLTEKEYYNEYPLLEKDNETYDNYIKTFESAIPSIDLVDNISNKIQEEFLRVYKHHLLENGYEEYVNQHPILKDLIPLKPIPLIKTSNKVKLSFISNVTNI